ncbi:hypothetical protein PoB_002128200 [Plakobranchus ocellatus]|uniref:HMG box domain-containing protein n=1 Tax=Plakobranchus ocellatus TaxID=259542 RepID=A0AAV3ZJR1_9GAST|nr:hypothetical protein PoB_002128200 [Plakobranchus ocellatus]
MGETWEKLEEKHQDRQIQRSFVEDLNSSRGSRVNDNDEEEEKKEEDEAEEAQEEEEEKGNMNIEMQS